MGALYCRSAVSTGTPAPESASTLASEIGPAEGGVVFLFASGAFAPRLAEMTESVKVATGATHAVGLVTSGPIRDRTEYEEIDAISALALSCDGLGVHPFTLDDAPPLPDTHPSPDEIAGLAGLLGVSSETRGTLLFVNGMRTPLVRLIPALSAAMPEGAGPLLGGLASGFPEDGFPMLALDGKPIASGVGISLTGPLTIDSVVSQAARPIGEPMVVTKARSNVILQLGGRTAVARIAEIAETLGEHERELLTSLPLIGRVVDEYKSRHGRGDFVVRNILGLDAASGSVAVADFIRPGQTVQLHVRDSETAGDDLAMLLEAQQLRDPPPAGALLIPCVSRGRAFFERPNHDAGAVCDAFSPRPLDPGVELAKAGVRIDPEGPGLPVAGFFADGEIGPLAGETFLHNHSACVALFRPA